MDYKIRDLMRLLHLSKRGIQKHLYVIKDLHPTSIDDSDERGTLLFSQEEVERFISVRRKPGRPRKYHARRK